MANRHGDFDLRFAQVSAPSQNFGLAWTLLPRHGARNIKEEAYQEMYSLLCQWKEERVILLVL